jgi:hypothetical protein
VEEDLNHNKTGSLETDGSTLAEESEQLKADLSVRG